MAETDDNQNAYRLRELTDGLDRLAELARELRAEQFSPAPVIGLVWPGAPLSLRLKFVRDILPEESTLQPKLRQASALEELRRRGDELETWLTRYPSLFADAVSLLNTCASDNEPADGKRDPAEMLALSTLVEAQQTLDRELAEYEIDWISPASGETIDSDHEVVGEEHSLYPRSTIARLVRPGFRRIGKLELPAQVVRSTGPDPTPSPIRALRPNLSHSHALEPPRRLGPVATAGTPAGAGTLGRGTGWPDTQPKQAPSPNLSHEGRGTGWPDTQREPEWLRILGQRTHGCDVEVVNELIRKLMEIVAFAGQAGSLDTCEAAGKQLASLLEPLTSLLTMRYADSLPGIGEDWGQALMEARDPILLWLRDTLAIEPIGPQRGESFDAATMDAVETRRTVHANEIETVARVERIGLMQNRSPILRAEVVRYVAGRE